MILMRQRFGRWVTKVAGGFGPDEAQVAGGGKEKEEQVAITTWSILLIGAIIISGAVIYWVSNAFYRQICMAALWGAFVGFTVLIYLPASVIITILGGLLGAGLSDLASVANIIERNAGSVNAIVTSLNSAFKNQVAINPMAVWLFLSILFLFCLPAYKKADDKW